VRGRYHLASSWSALHGAEDNSNTATICIRCPIGTEKLRVGGNREECMPCADKPGGVHDHDNDPSTACSTGFVVLSYSRPAAAPPGTAQAGATYIQMPDENGVYVVGSDYQFGELLVGMLGARLTSCSLCDCVVEMLVLKRTSSVNHRGGRTRVVNTARG
jgi:hypothetical protein